LLYQPQEPSVKSSGANLITNSITQGNFAIRNLLVVLLSIKRITAIVQHHQYSVFRSCINSELEFSIPTNTENERGPAQTVDFSGKQRDTPEYGMLR